MPETTAPSTAEAYPAWVQEMREVFRAGTVSQFLIHGNVYDLVPYRAPDSESLVRAPSPEGVTFLPLKEFLVQVLFAQFDLVVYYSRGAGIKALRGQEHLTAFLKLLDDWTHSNYAGGPLPRDTGQALELLDGILRYSVQRTAVEGGKAVRSPLRTALVIDFVQFLAPQGEAQLGERASETLIRMLDWASDPGLLGAHVATVLIAESLAGLSRSLVENPYNAKIHIPLPDEADCLQFLNGLRQKYPELEASTELALPVMAQKVVGLTRVNLQHMVALAVKNRRKITSDYLTRIKKELIEKECYGLLEFIETDNTLDQVAGHESAKKWLREDAQLIREGKTSAIPMGYLMTGRIGTGKTWLTHCWAGEVGVPFVVFKNFRDKWMGATEGNLEKIFHVLRALGQVIVFVDEADQMTGKRGGGDSDSGLGGRVYAMLAQEMSDTNNRGRIVWVFATSRPDLLEVDLKRPGRLDVHIPLFPPQNDAERRALFCAMARKVGLPLALEDLPELPGGQDIGGNEMEALMVRGQRRWYLEPGSNLKEILAQLLVEYRPLPHVKNLEYMDLIAVKECTDRDFLPERYRDLPLSDLDRRLEELRRELRLS
ncbi:MAG: ATP-binding protein [Armatimonadetes bacterium]|nr:ATP-binding protein [Armatimonadota bacterium]